MTVACVGGRRPHVRERTNGPTLPRTRLTLNFASAATSRVDELLPGGMASLGLTGAGVLVGEWDEAGARLTHEDLRGRVLLGDAAGAADHSTHVAGTLVGNGIGQAMARGMAPSADLLSYDWTFDLLELRERAPHLAVSTHAYGFRMGWAVNPSCPDRPSWMGRPDENEDRAFGKYGPEAAALDAVAYDTGLLSVWAGGNERQDVGAAGGQPHYHYPDCSATATDEHAAEAELQYDTMGLQLAAKNALVVGAADDLTSWPATPTEIAVLPFSSYGPMDDGRVKPDLVASGAQVLSTVASADDAYGSYSGTSSSAAVVAGGIALLTEHFRRLHAGRDPRAEELRAVLVEAAAPKGPDGRPTYEAGYGLFDARAAADLLSSDAALTGAQKQIRLGVAQSGKSETVETAELQAGTGLRVTLVWTDPAGAPNPSGVDDPTPALVNDLDLALIAPDHSTEFYPWSLAAGAPSAQATRTEPNRVDNVEVLVVPAADNTWSGAWTVRVSAANLYRLRPQAYALASSVPIGPSVSPVLGAPRSLLLEVPMGTTPAPVNVQLENLGSGALHWSASAEVPWLSLSKTDGTAPDTIALAFDTNAFAAPSEHFGTIALTSDDSNGPSTIGVVLRLTCAADCSGRVCGPDPACGQPCGACAAGETCNTSGQCTAWAASCPASDLGTSLGPLLASGTTQGAGNRDRGSCGGDGDELAFRWTAPADGRYRFTTEGSAFDTLLYLRDACGGRELACADSADGANAVLGYSLRAGESVVAVVDGKAGSGPFHFGVQVASCPDADLGQRLGVGLTRLSLSGSIDRVAGSCGGKGQVDGVLTWTAPADGEYSFALEDASQDDVLYLLEGDCDGRELGCAAQASRPTLTRTLSRGQRVVVVIEDGHGRELGLSITASAGECAGNCDGSPNHGQCFCDAACVTLHDCCADACQLCGHCCVPVCDGKQCGDDGCSGSCGTCGQDELCDRGRCVHDPCAGAASGASCDDGDACTGNDHCVGGRCAGSPLVCDDGNVCTRDRCDPERGLCASTPIGGCCNVDANCDDGELCTTDRCVRGSCVHEPNDPCPSRLTDAGRGDGGPKRRAQKPGAAGCGCRVAGRRAAAPAGNALLCFTLVMVALRLRRAHDCGLNGKVCSRSSGCRTGSGVSRSKVIFTGLRGRARCEVGRGCSGVATVALAAQGAADPSLWELRAILDAGQLKLVDPICVAGREILAALQRDPDCNSDAARSAFR